MALLTMKTNKTTCRTTNNLGMQAEDIGELFALFEDAEASDVPVRVDYFPDEGGTIAISLGLSDPRVTRAAEELGSW